MGVATAISLAGLGLSAYQGIKGAQATAAANQAADQAAENLSRIKETNKMQELRLPTLGTQLAQQNLQARQAANIQALQQGGAATVLGGLTAANQQAQAQDLQLAAQADEMQYQRDAALAQNAQQLEQNRVQREFGLGQMKLTGAQAAAAEGRQQVNAAMAGGLQSLSNAAQIKMYQDIYGNKPETPVVDKTGSVTSISKTAADAFKPQIASMRPNVKPINVQNQLQSNNLAGLRAAQGQYETMQADQLAGLRRVQGMYDSDYTYNPYNNEWVQNAPY